MIHTDLPQSYCGSTSSGLTSSVSSWLTSMLHQNNYIEKVDASNTLCLGFLVYTWIALCWPASPCPVNITIQIWSIASIKTRGWTISLELWGRGYIGVLPGLSNWEPLGQRWVCCLIQSCAGRRLSRKQTNWKCRNWWNSGLLIIYYWFTLQNFQI